jgi:hypothetical protein
VALQTTRPDGNADAWLINTADLAAPGPLNLGLNGGNDADFFAGWSPRGDALLLRSGPMLYLTSYGGTPVQLGTAPVFAGDRRAGTAPSWSPDASHIAYFDNDPAAGGQLHIVRTDGSVACGPFGNINSAVWSPRDPQLWTLFNPPDGPQALTVINLDCSSQGLTTFDRRVDRMQFDPAGNNLALVSYADGAGLVMLVNGGLIPIDMAKANVAFADAMTWSPGGDMLPIYAGGPSVSLWVVQPGSDAPVMVTGSTLPAGAQYVTAVWWG